MPGVITPLTIELPAIVPVPINVPAEATKTSPVPVGEEPATTSVPLDTVVPPLYVLAPEKVVVPDPVKVKPPVPENTPDSVALPEVGTEIVPPADVTANDCEELAPEVSANVPPVKTGLVVTPMVARLKDPPVEMLVGVGVGVGVGGVGGGGGGGGGAGVSVTIKSQIVGDPPSGESVQFRPLNVPVTAPPI